ncbi:unnamed protein product [Gongylonema pulchrum]|uniref:RRM domain-containing protein n=1 Tax=Gongylonema pulchrum TaxID=637853 RepID=A0A3P7NHB6_9BILA|nr:unnamed protein product [Gongylonema pulchrum]VDN45043.1 unnamed protein product [Gongylonema pulchrum]
MDDRKEGELPIGLRGVGMGLGANGAPLGDVSSVISSLSSSASAHGTFDGAAAPYSGQTSYPSSGISSVLPFSSTFGSSSTATPLATVSTGGYSSFGSASGYSASRSIIIKNLPLDYTWQIVRDRVQQFGPVDVTEMIAPGCAKVTFAISADAERARKSLQNTTVEGRVIGVEFLVP